MKRLTIFSMVYFLFFFSFVYSKENPKGISLVKTGNGYIVDFTLPKYQILTTRANNENFRYFDVEGYGLTSEIGLPQLPQLSFYLFISQNENTPLISDVQQQKELIFLDSKIYPFQIPWEKTKNLDDRPFVINEEYYRSRGNFDGPFVKISEPFIMGGAKGVMVTIFPFAYNPSTGEVNVTYKGSFKINLNFEPSLSFIPMPTMNKFFDEIFVNYNAGKSTGTGRMLIITAPEYESGLTPFVTHKTNMGLIVSVVNTNTTGTSNTAIKNYIQTQYNNINTRPEFIVLVGDVDKIPDWIGIGNGSPHTDWNYALLEGNDQYVDAFLGRFPVQNLTQLANMINKTIYTETNINNLWKKNVFMASTDNHLISEGTHNFVIDNYFIPHGYTVNTKLYSYYGATTQQVKQSIDSGKIYAIYSGHGSETSWADGPPFSQSDVNSLNNTMYPFVYSFACLTGSFHVSYECFAETWVRSSKAATVFWGSSVTSYWAEDDTLERKIIKALFDDGLKQSSPMFVKGKVYLVASFGGFTPTMQRYVEMYNLMGDPSVYQDSYGPVISHTPLPNTENLIGPYTVNCTVTPAGGFSIVSTKLFWTRTNSFDSVNMTNTSGNNWTGNIPGNGAPAVYKYYLKTIDAGNRITYLPGGAPANYFSFVAATDTAKPVITHTPLTNCPKLQWPSTVVAVVTDNIGVDSVWVKWYKNNPSTGIKQFRLNNTNGSNYSAPFNSTQSEVNYNDSIFYRIYARDVSSLHNVDSTALYQFKIVAQTTAIIGTGTSSSNYPYTTYWMDGRTDMLYLASEILAANGSAGNIIKIGFNVISNSSQMMNGFKVKMMHTTNTSLTGFTNSPLWAIVYDGTYIVPGTGWQYIDLQTPFYWNGTDNLLIEICYNNSSYTTYSPVYATSIANRTWGQYSDLSSGDGCVDLNSGSSQSVRPNISITINTITGLVVNTSFVPDRYALDQNYPNPFNPVTKIKFDLPKQGFVSLKVYDILGREIRTLINENKFAGSYIVEFNGSDLPSGVYFYRLEVNGYREIRKMILVK